MNSLTKLAALVRYPTVWRALVSTGTAAAVEHMGMLRHVQPDTVIDVGANKGQFALAAVAAGARRVISFEPLGSEADIFERNLGSDERIQLHRFALAESEGEATFHVASRPDSSSLLPIGARQTKAFNVSEVRTISVQMRRLDSVITVGTLERTVLLKIDVQGAEMRTVAGATALLPKIRYVYAEGSFVELYSGQPLAGDLIGTLDEAGFALRGFYNAAYSAAYGPTQADMLFENRALAGQPPATSGA